MCERDGVMKTHKERERESVGRGERGRERGRDREAQQARVQYGRLPESVSVCERESENE